MNKKVIIAGAGLCGTMIAIKMAQRGHKVDLFEKRDDLRIKELDAGRSINLALSDRGLKALRMIGIEESAKALTIPMYGRMIHFADGQKKLYRYSGRESDFINSISRPGLNTLLLGKADEYENLTIHFSSPCTRVDLSQGIAHFSSPDQGQLEYKADLIIGADGAGSAVRKSMSRLSNQLRFSFSQNFLETGYKELSILPGTGGSHQIEKNALHIWPRKGFMLIALPNLDGSFTVTLFLPFDGDNGFDALDTDQKITAFFEANFPDALQLMPQLLEDYHHNPTSSLGTIKCFPWTAYSKVLVMGDAAHAVVPFYGQGMNCSFEDCVELDKSLDMHNDDFAQALSSYQQSRKKDADAIADLAEENFYEMAAHTADPVFNFKRKLELAMEQAFSDYYSKYSMVTFKEDLPYSVALNQGRKQDMILLDIARRLLDTEDYSISNVYFELSQRME